VGGRVADLCVALELLLWVRKRHCRPPRQPVDLAATTKDIKLRIKRVLVNLEPITQQRDPILPDPCAVWLDITLSIVELESVTVMKRVWWPQWRRDRTGSRSSCPRAASTGADRVRGPHHEFGGVASSLPFISAAQLLDKHPSLIASRFAPCSACARLWWFDVAGRMIHRCLALT
jgi:hypothetical protein